jgi:phosphoribosylformimino-5-aminoimidazole carboxamide ribotide isomerase
MQILPAIDLREGRVVRLAEGDYDRQTTYGEDPAAVAGQFVACGARRVHMVDLDAARSGRSMNLPSVRAVAEAVDVKIELGGGARDDDSLRAMFAAGADRVVVGSAALGDWPWFERTAHAEEFRNRLVLGLDARKGLLAVRGWTEQTDLDAEQIARNVAGWPLAGIVYTDIARDGMLTGVNVEATERIVRATDVPVIASGGVGSIEDVRLCREAGCAGVIIGRAWYEGRIDLREAVELAGPQS